MRTYRWARSCGWLFILAALGTASSSAHAQGAPTQGVKGPARAQGAPAQADASQKADALFRKGKDLYKGGKLQEAYEAYRSAWELKPSYDIAANLANTEMLLGKKRDAAEHLAYCLHTFAATGDQKQQAQVKKRLAEVRKEVGALAIKVSVDGAEVLVDGMSVGRAPFKDEVFVEPGARVVEAKLAGYEPARQSVQVQKGGAAQEVTLTLLGSKATQAAGFAGVPEGGVSGVQDGAGTSVPHNQGAPGRTPPSNGGHGDTTSDVWRPGPAWFIAGGAVAVVGLGAGLGFTLAANGRSDAAGKLREGKSPSACAGPTGMVGPVCSELHDTLVAQSRWSNTALLSFVVGGAVALGTAGLGVWTLTQPESPPAPPVRVVPVVGMREGGLMLLGAW